MSPGWSSDFSYGYFRQILQAIQSNFEWHLLCDALEILDTSGKPKLILRHDIDISLKMALKMAEIEHDFGICATYMVITNAPFYCLDDKVSKDILRQLIAMGHEVALHFDLDDAERNNHCTISLLDAKIQSACKQLEQIIDRPVHSISFHRPMPQFLRGPLTVSGMINAYAQELMDWYLSDSKGCWREGEPLPKLLRPEKSLLQLLIHPFWWGDEHMSPEDRLQEFFDAETQGQSHQYQRALDAHLIKNAAIQRSGSRNEAKEGGE